MEEIYCFGIESLGKYPIGHLTTSSVFNIGIYLGSVAVLFAGYSILNEKNKFRIKFCINEKYLRVFFLFGLFSSFVGYILPYIGFEAINIIGYPIFWEILSSIIYIIFLLIIYYSAITPINISKKNIKKLTDYVIIEIAKGEEGVKIIGDELGYFFNDLLESSVIDENKDYITLFSILGDNNLCKYIGRTSLRTFIIITNSYISFFDKGGFKKLENYYKHEYYSFYRKIFNYSLSHENSILYREINGISFDKINSGNGIYTIGIIESFPFIKELGLLSKDYGFELNENEEFNYYKTFIGLWNKILESFFTDIEKNIENSDYLYQGYSVISYILTQIKYKEFYTKISFLPNYIDLKDEFIKEYYNKRYGKEFKDIFIENSHYFDTEGLIDKNNDLINILSISLFKLLTSCDRLYDNNLDNTYDEWYVRFTVNHLYNDYSSKYPYSIIKNNLKELFIEGIKNNLNLWLGTTVLPIFIDLYGYELFVGKSNNDNEDFFIRFLKILGEGLPKIVDGSIYNINDASEIEKIHIINKCNKGLQTLFINKESIFYNRENNKLIYYLYDKSSAREIDLNEVLETGEINIKQL